MLIPTNNNILVKLDLTNVTEKGFVFSEEIKGDGQVVKCKAITESPFHSGIKVGTFLYIPFYALRQVRNDIYACDYKSIIAYDDNN